MHNLDSRTILIHGIAVKVTLERIWIRRERKTDYRLEHIVRENDIVSISFSVRCAYWDVIHFQIDF